MASTHPEGPLARGEPQSQCGVWVSPRRGARHEQRQAGRHLARAGPSLTRMAPHPPAGFSVNGQLIGNRAGSPGQHQGTYFGRLGIVNPTTGFQLEVTPHNITLNPGSGGPVFSWRDQASLRQHE